MVWNNELWDFLEFLFFACDNVSIPFHSDWPNLSPRQPFKRGISFNVTDTSGDARSPERPQSETGTPTISVNSPGLLSPPPPHVTTKPKSASFSVKPPPPRRLSWFSSPGEAARQREREIRVGGRTKSRTMSIDQGRSSSRDCQTDKEDQSEPAQQQHHSHFSDSRLLNHLRSSFKHYTSKNRNKEIGWYAYVMKILHYCWLCSSLVNPKLYFSFLVWLRCITSLDSSNKNSRVINWKQFSHRLAVASIFTNNINICLLFVRTCVNIPTSNTWINAMFLLYSNR